MKYKTKQDKQTKTKDLGKGLIERTMSILENKKQHQKLCTQKQTDEEDDVIALMNKASRKQGQVTCKRNSLQNISFEVMQTSSSGILGRYVLTEKFLELIKSTKFVPQTVRMLGVFDSRKDS